VTRSEAGRPRLRILRTDELTDAEVARIRGVMLAAFGTDPDEAFTDDDWAHAEGGRHIVLDLDDEVITHAAVVERELHVAGRPLRTGYVEAVATAPSHDGRGYGSQVMEAVNAHIRDTYELGALGTGRFHFYERLGWERWRGRAFVRGPRGLEGTPDEEGFILVLRTPRSPSFDLDGDLSCEWRPGDVW
jgi:aminoglycoside 2'-N-acetyltransferase I